MKKLVFSIIFILIIAGLFAFSIGVSATETIYSGECGANGNNVMWKLNADTGKLTISGTGAMKDFSSYMPWYSYTDLIKSVDIQYGITKIGAYSFQYVHGLEEVTIPNTVSVIGRAAFSGCDRLRSISLPNSLTTIEHGAFEKCVSLVSITIPKNVNNIDFGAFRECCKLVEVINRSSLDLTPNDFYTGFFEGCECQVHNLSQSKIVNNNGLRFMTDSTGEVYLIDYVGENKNVVLPEQYNGKSYSVYKYAFYKNDVIESISVSSGVKSIGDYAFYACPNLNTVNMESGVDSIGEFAFYGCENLEDVELSDSITMIDDWTFTSCDNLSSVTLPDNLGTIPAYMFSGCIKLSHVDLPKNLDTIMESAFSYTNLSEIAIPRSVTRVEHHAFASAGIEKVYIEDVVSWCNIKFDGYAASPLSYGATDLLSAAKLYINNELVTDVILPEGIKNIPQDAFSCENLTSISISDSVTDIGDKAFYNCGSLKSVVIGSSVKNIGELVFAECPALESIVVNNNKTFHSDSNCLIDTNSRTLIYGCKSSVIPSDGTVTSIGNNAFYYCFTLEEIVIPDSIVSIGEHAFYMCSGLHSITIGNNVTKIGASAFCYCYAMEEIVIPDSVVSIGERAFSMCSGLHSITIGNNVTKIGASAFYECKGLVEVINHSLINIEKGSTDNGYVANYAIEVHDGNQSRIDNQNDFIFYTDLNGNDYLVTYVGNESSILFPEYHNGREYSIHNYAFEQRDDIKKITLSPNITGIGDYAFYECDGLSSVTIPGKVTIIGENAFNRCRSIVSVTLPSSIVSIGRGAFEYCYKLVEVINNSSLNIKAGSRENGYVAYYALEVNSGEASKIINKNDYLFYTDAQGTNYLVGYVGEQNSLVLPEHYDNHSYVIGDYAFLNSTNIESVEISSGVTNIGYCSFYGCSNLSKLFVSDSVTNIESGAFNNCNNLKCIYVSSADVVTKLLSAEACGRLLYNVQSIFVESSISNPGEYITDTFNFVETASYRDVEYKSYGLHKHDWIEHNEKATCYADGFDGYECSVCDALKGNAVPSLSHVFDDENDMDCNECGYTKYIVGDLDGNGGITKDDAVYLLMYTFFPDNYPTYQPIDYDGDGEITKDDAVYLLMYTFFPDDYPITNK